MTAQRTEQIPLWPPRSHTNDPATSHEAEAKNPELRGAHMTLVYMAVVARPGSTSSEIADGLMGDPHFSSDSHRRLYQVRRRLSDLRVRRILDISGRRGDESTWVVRT